MGGQVVNAVLVVHRAVALLHVDCAKAVFNDKQRQLVVIPEPVEGVAQPHRVNLPAPVRFLHVRVRDQALALVIVQLRVVRRRLGGEGHIIAKPDVIHAALRQRDFIFFGDIQREAATFKVVEQMLRILTAHMDVGEPVAAVHGVHRHHHVVRRAGQRVDGAHGNHAADLQGRVNLAPRLHRQGAGHQFIVRGLEHHRLTIFTRRVLQPGVGKRRKIFMEVGLVVDLVKGHPVLDFMLIALENHFRKTNEEVDQLTVAPAAVFRDQVERHLEVGKRNHRFDAVLQALVEQIVIEFQTGFVRLKLVTFREDTRPGDGGTEAFEPHLGKEFDVFFIAVIEIDGFMVRVIFPLKHAVGDFARYAVRTRRHHIGNANALAALFPAALKLMRRNGTTPQKICFKS